MKKAPLAFVALVFLLCLPGSLVPQSSRSLDWQIQFLSGKARESKPVNETIKMENGGEFRFVIKADSDSYCYVICYTSDKQLIILYDQALKGETTKNFGPLGVTEPSGTEIVYVIMSLSRQTNLERLIGSHKSNQDSRQHANNLYHEIVNLQNTVSGLGEPVSSIITGGGTNRSVGNDDQNFVTKFSGKDIYVRPITVNH